MSRMALACRSLSWYERFSAAAAILQRQHRLCQRLRRDRDALSGLAEGRVLAVLAVQVAPGEKDGPRAAAAHQWVLLAKVRAIARDEGLHAGAAAGAEGLQAVDVLAEDHGIDGRFLAAATGLAEAARAAPTAANRQRFQLIVIHTKGREEELRRVYNKDWFVQPPLAICACRYPMDPARKRKDYTDVDMGIVVDHQNVRALVRHPRLSL